MSDKNESFRTHYGSPATPSRDIPHKRRTASSPSAWAASAVLALACTAQGEPAPKGNPAAGASPFIFTDASQSSGLKPFLRGALNHAIAWGDVDGDGRPDLFLGNFDKGPDPKYGLKESVPNDLFRQTDAGKFVPMRVPQARGRATGAVLVDLDNDGDLDLYVSNNTHAKPRPAKPSANAPSALYRNDGGAFAPVAGGGLTPPAAAFGRDVGVFDFDSDGLLDLLVLEDKVFRDAGHSRLYRNLGGLKFEDVTEAAGLPPDLDGFGVAVADVNGDGLPDFFVGGPNRLYLGRPGGKFEEAKGLRAVFEHRPADAEDFVAGAEFGDVNGDGHDDLLLGVHHTPARVRVFLGSPAGGDGAPKFRDVTDDLGIPALPNKGATCQVADFDNDGRPDLYWSVWFAEGERRTPFICRNLGDGPQGLPRFAVPSVEGIPLNRKNVAPAAGRGMVYYVNGPAVDYDGDGGLDFMAGIWPDENSRLFHNDTPGRGNWLAVTCEGSKSNRMGIGAKVTLLDDAGRPIGLRQMFINGGYSGSRPAVAHFGLGKREAVDVSVVFPGREEPVVVKGVKANGGVVVKEPR